MLDELRRKPEALPAEHPRSRLIIIALVAVGAAALIAGEMLVGNVIVWVALGLTLTALLLSFPEVCLGLFLTAGTYKNELAGALNIDTDPTVLLGGMLLAGVAVRVLRRGVRPLVPPRQVVLPFALLVLVMAFSVLGETAGEYGRQKFLRFALLTGVATVAAYATIQSTSELKRFLATTIVLGVMMTALGRVAGEGLSAFGATHVATGRVIGLALLGVLFMLLAVRRQPLFRLALLGVAGLLAFGFLSSGSRGSMVALLTTLAVTALASFTLKRGRRWVVAGLALMTAVGAVSSMLVPSATETMNRRVIEVIATPNAIGSARGREQRAQDALALFYEHPWTGVGVGGFDMARGYGDAARGDYPHNILLEIACELGVFGLAAFLGLIVPALRSAFRALRQVRTREEFATAAVVFATTIYFLVNAMFSGDLNDNRLLFAALGLCAALPRMARAHPTTPGEERSVKGGGL
jgi:O-antigen ligase